MFKKRIYLDYNATMPVSDEVATAIMEALQNYGNPSSVHTEGQKANRLLESNRQKIANLFNIDKDKITFTSGATEAAATLLTPHWKMGRSKLVFSHLYIGATEHPCVAKGHSFKNDQVTSIPVNNDGLINIDFLTEALTNHDKNKGLPLVSIQAANSETGVLQDIPKLYALVKNYGAIFIVDAVQYIGRYKISNLSEFADFIFISGHKIGAAKGIGAFINSSNLLAPDPLLKGGGQEKGLRSGTQSVPLIASFGTAAEQINKQLDSNLWNNEKLTYLENALQNICPDIIIYGKNVKRLPNTCYFTIPHKKAETLQIAFDLCGIAVSSGKACSSSRVSINEVILAMGYNPDNGAIRVSIGLETQLSDLDQFIRSFKQILNN
ncbi:cysteine desulfurase family protein [Bartonella sp. DGB1]|uniref:cysteine desulfurase family protein n=1 Tax=Bartonella sp. DGB1 TaxID=3239807 RepID=UPI003523E3B6